MKDNIILSVVTVILFTSAYNLVNDQNEMHEHEEFFIQMIEFKESTEAFKSKGGRNTNAMGRALCERINIIEMTQSLVITNCNEIYK